MKRKKKNINYTKIYNELAEAIRNSSKTLKKAQKSNDILFPLEIFLTIEQLKIGLEIMEHLKMGKTK